MKVFINWFFSIDFYKKNGANVIFRGIENVKDTEKQLRDSDDVFIGRGAFSHGIFFSTDLGEAEHYKKSNGEIIETIIHPKAKIINIKDVRNLDKEDRNNVLNNNFDNFDGIDKEKLKNYYQAENGRTRVPIKASLLGYDIIDMNHNVYVILNRKALIMKGDN